MTSISTSIRRVSVSEPYLTDAVLDAVHIPSLSLPLAAHGRRLLGQLLLIVRLWGSNRGVNGG